MHQNKSISFDEGNFHPQVEIDSYKICYKPYESSTNFDDFIQNHQDYIEEQDVQKVRAFSQLNPDQEAYFQYQIIQILVNHLRVEQPLRNGNLNQAIDELKNIENLLEKKVSDYQTVYGIHLLYLKLGNLHLYKKEFPVSLDYYTQARKYIQKVDQNMDCAKIEYALALAHQSLNQSQDTLKHLILGFQLQVKFKGEKDSENLIICRKIIENLKTQHNQEQSLLFYCKKYLQIAEANGFYSNAQEQLDYYSIVKCTARMLLNLKAYTEGKNILERCLSQLYTDTIHFQNQEIYLYEISKLLIQFHKQTIDYKRCELIFEVLITVSKQIYGEESINTAHLLSDLGHLQSVMLNNEKAYQTLKKSFQIFKKQEQYQSDPKYLQLMQSMQKLPQELHSQNAISQRLQVYDIRNEKTTLSIMEEFNRVGKLYCKHGQMQKSLKNYEVSQILFQQLPPEIKELDSIQKMENKLLINYSILLINQNQHLVALIFLNQITIQEYINNNSQQEIQFSKGNSTTTDQYSEESKEEQEKREQIVGDNFQVYYRKGLCFEKLEEKNQALEFFIKAQGELKKSLTLQQNNQEKKEQIERKIEEYSCLYQMDINSIA